MNKHNEKIENLKKITLSVEAGATPNSMNLTSQSFQSEFIFGLGTDGLVPFEYELSDKTEGDEILLHLKQEKIHEMFQHINMPFPRFSEHPDSFYLKVQVVKVVQADDREIVRALAEIASCGSHCCGDGCSHF